MILVKTKAYKLALQLGRVGGINNSWSACFVQCIYTVQSNSPVLLLYIQASVLIYPVNNFGLPPDVVSVLKLITTVTMMRGLKHPYAVYNNHRAAFIIVYG